MYSSHGARTDTSKLFVGHGDDQTDKIVDINLEQVPEVVSGVVALRKLVIGLIPRYIVCELVGWQCAYFGFALILCHIPCRFRCHAEERRGLYLSHLEGSWYHKIDRFARFLR